MVCEATNSHLLNIGLENRVGMFYPYILCSGMITMIFNIRALKFN